jgi:AP endonuclease 2
MRLTSCNIIGSRIDYILASKDLLDRLEGADISADIIGSDHCPVWATLTFPTTTDPNPPSTSADQRPPPPRLCARYLSHAVPTQSIRSLFVNIPGHIVLRSNTSPSKSPSRAPEEKGNKRPVAAVPKPTKQKKQKTSGTAKTISKDTSSQRSMNEFFKAPKPVEPPSTSLTTSEPSATESSLPSDDGLASLQAEPIPRPDSQAANQQWTSIFTKKGPPLCDTHGLPCTELVTKKPGPNLGRRFWICSKPVGPGYDNGKSTGCMVGTG